MVVATIFLRINFDVSAKKNYIALLNLKRFER